MARLDNDCWDDIKLRWQGGEDLRSISKDYDIDHTTIGKRAKREGWIMANSTQLNEAVDATIAARKKVQALANSTNSPKIPQLVELKANDKERADNIGMLLLDRAAELARDCYDAGELQKLSATHKNIYDGRFKTTVDSATQVNVGVTGFEVVIE
jgi:replicative superfamily II helicase